MTDESRRVYSSAGDRIQLVTYRCRVCEKQTEVTVPDSTRFRVFKYGVCAECAASEWGRLIGVRVAEDSHGALKG